MELSLFEGFSNPGPPGIDPTPNPPNTRRMPSETKEEQHFGGTSVDSASHRFCPGAMRYWFARQLLRLTSDVKSLTGRSPVGGMKVL